MSWLATLADLVEREGAAARAVIIATDGPTPRAVGSDMLVSRTAADGKIGRGEAQLSTISLARALIGRLQQTEPGEAAWLRTTQRLATGNVLGRESGGSITVLVEAFGPAEIAALAARKRSGHQALLVARPLESGIPARLLWRGMIPPSGISGSQPCPLGEAANAARSEHQSEGCEPHRGSEPSPEGISHLPVAWADSVARLLDAPHLKLLCLEQPGAGDVVIETAREAQPAFHVYGTGLVARALVDVLATLPFQVIWIDTAPGHFPQRIPAGVEVEVAGDVVTRAGRSRPGTFHAVMTSAHDLDLDVCRALLATGHFAYLGVIGSRLKRKRMLECFRGEGIGEAGLARISCPIGLEELRSKTPSVIAVGIAAEALLALSPQSNQTPALHETRTQSTGSKP